MRSGQSPPGRSRAAALTARGAFEPVAQLFVRQGVHEHLGLVQALLGRRQGGVRATEGDVDRFRSSARRPKPPGPGAGLARRVPGLIRESRQRGEIAARVALVPHLQRQNRVLPWASPGRPRPLEQRRASSGSAQPDLEMGQVGDHVGALRRSLLGQELQRADQRVTGLDRSVG